MSPSVLITGASCDVATQLLPQLSDAPIIGVDIRPPDTTSNQTFYSVDLGRESSCPELVHILRNHNIETVFHLAFADLSTTAGPSAMDGMWQSNVAGTARVMEAISVVNRTGGRVRKFLCVGSALAYGSETAVSLAEDKPLQAQSLPFAISKREVDEVIQYRAESLGPCHTYLLRASHMAGPRTRNIILNCLRGIPTGNSLRAASMQKKGRRLPFVLPVGRRYLEAELQFLHIDDMARLLSHLGSQPAGNSGITILNAAGRGNPLTMTECVEIAGARLRRVPGRAFCSSIMRSQWKKKIAPVHPDALSYFLRPPVLDTSRLHRFLGGKLPEIIRFSSEEALRDAFAQL